ncbi:hypothetical protein CGCF413_v004655 [Colletotrichum fructicola]|nr:hypothetical protein CGCF413_v004655 [Colletotrichum fructicola]
MVGLSMVNRRAAPPPRLDLEIVRPNFGGSLSQPSLSPTNTIFVTQPPQTVTVTAPAVVPTLPSTSHTSSTIPLPSEAADTTPQPSALPANNGVSFTTGAGVVVIGVLGGIASASLLGKWWADRKIHVMVGFVIRFANSETSFCFSTLRHSI